MEERRRNLDSGDDNLLPDIHLRDEMRVFRNRRPRGDIATDAEILGERTANEVVEVEIVGKCHHARL